MSFETKGVLADVATAVAGDAVPNRDYPVTFNCRNPGGTSATVLVQGSTDGGTSWHTMHTFTMAAGDSQVYTDSNKWPLLRGNVTAITGGVVNMDAVV